MNSAMGHSFGGAAVLGAETPNVSVAAHVRNTLDHAQSLANGVLVLREMLLGQQPRDPRPGTPKSPDIEPVAFRLREAANQANFDIREAIAALEAIAEEFRL